MNKGEIRMLAVAKRALYTELQCREMNLEITKRFSSFFSNFTGPKKKVHIFLSILEKKEVDTNPLIDFIKENFPSTTLVVSKADFSNNSMQHYQYDSTSSFKVNRYGIPEPVEGLEVDASELDIVLVPLLAYDRVGNRVGYGKGFYDRFLAECRPDCFKLGLSFEEPYDAIEVDKHDVRLNACLSLNKVYTF